MDSLPAIFAQGIFGGNYAIQSTVLFIVLLICAFASSAETALTSLNRVRIENLAEEGDERARQIEAMLERRGDLLTTILVINNVAIILASSLATVIALALSPRWGEVISTVAISIVALVFCEILPKNAALQNPERWSRIIIPVVVILTLALRPLTGILNGLTGGISRMLGIPAGHIGPSVTEQEILLMANKGEREGVIEREERTMISSVLDLADTAVREVMVPSLDIKMLPIDATLNEAVEFITTVGFSRIPMYDESIDHIVGVIYAKDLLRVLQTHDPDFRVQNLARKPLFVPESKKLDDLLHEMQRRKVHMALVFNEYGSITGLVTIEDLVEEIFGEIQDEYDNEMVMVEQKSATEYEVDARMHIEDFAETLGIKQHLDPAETSDYDSVAGYMVAHLNKIPQVGDSVRFDGSTLTVLATRGRRILRARAVLDEPLPVDHADSAHRDHEKREAEQQREDLLDQMTISGPLSLL